MCIFSKLNAIIQLKYMHSSGTGTGYLSGHQSSLPVCSGIRVAQYLVFCVMCCWSLSVLFPLAIVLSVLFPLAIVLSVLFRLTVLISPFKFVIFKHFCYALNMLNIDSMQCASTVSFLNINIYFVVFPWLLKLWLQYFMSSVCLSAVLVLCNWLQR